MTTKDRDLADEDIERLIVDAVRERPERAAAFRPHCRLSPKGNHMSGQTLYLTDRIRGLLTEIDREDGAEMRRLSDALVTCKAELDAYREGYEAAVEIIANHLQGRGNTDRAIAMIERAVRVRKGLVEEAAP